MFKSKRMHLRAEFGLPRQAEARSILEAEQPLLRGLLGHLHHRDDRTAQWGEVLAIKWTAEYESLDPNDGGESDSASVQCGTHVASSQNKKCN